MKNSLTIEEKVARLATGSIALKDLPAKIDKVIKDNIEEALHSHSQYIKQKAIKLKLGVTQ